MQELIETFEEMRSPIDSKVEVDFAISLAKSLLEKEKEVIMQVLNAGKAMAVGNKENKSLEYYYNETFNGEKQ